MSFYTYTVSAELSFRSIVTVRSSAGARAQIIDCINRNPLARTRGVL